MTESPSCRFSVAVRVRPKLQNACNVTQTHERYEKLACTALSEASLRLWDGKESKDSRSYQFSFDHIFNTDASQEEVYENAVVDAVDATLAGTNATIMAYGQTGSGKTYTILGNPTRNAVTSHGEDVSAAGWSVESGDAGVLLRSVLDILGFADRMRHRRHVVVGVSVLELYQDDVRDLLREAPVATALPIAMAKDVVRVPGLTHVPILKAEDIYDVYAQAAARRVQRATGANDTSSRSHAIFSIEVFQIPVAACPDAPTLASLLAMREAYLVSSLDASRRTGGQVSGGKDILASAGAEADFFAEASNPVMGNRQCPVLYSKLTVADLAGSEKVRQSNVTGAGFDELRRINASLTALGNVVHSLYESAKHIPYRDSRLTMLLRDAFAAPSARVVLIANVSPTVLTVDETLSSLFFADKIKAIKTAGNKVDQKQQSLEAAYLTAVHAHDAFLAEVRIFQSEQSLAPGAVLRKAAMSSSTRKALFDPTLHISTLNKRSSAVAMGNLCEALTAERAAAPADARQAAFLTAQHQHLCEQYMDRHRRHWTKAASELQRLEDEQKRFHDATGTQLAVLEKAIVSAKGERKQLALKRQMMEKDASAKTAQLADVKKQEVHVSGAWEAMATALQCASDDIATQEQFVASGERADDAWVETTLLAERALEAAQMRQQLVEAMRGNVESQTHTGKAPRSRTQPSVEEWMRHAVLAMAGNAVVQSMRRGAAAHADPAAVPLQTITNFNTVGKKPKYWTREMQAQKHAHVDKKHIRSTFDDPHLLDRIVSFMDMGAALDKRGHDGRLKRRMFYVTQAEKEPMLRWEEARPSIQSFREKGKVPLRNVTRILLGQTSPTFISYTADDKASRFFSSFSVEYSEVRSKRHDTPAAVAPANTRYVDIMCDSLADMETWVAGLSMIAGVYPSFSDAREPTALDDVPVLNTANDDTIASAELSTAARQLCEEWHIPNSVFAEAQREINERRTRHSSGMLSVTPGELRGLTHLDIFRASAMWGYFYSNHMVRAPASSVFCFVPCAGLTPMTPFRWRVEKLTMQRRESEASASAGSLAEVHESVVPQHSLSTGIELYDEPATEPTTCAK